MSSRLSFSGLSNDFSDRVQEYKNGRIVLNDGQRYIPYETYTGSSQPQTNFNDTLKGIHQPTKVSNLFFSKENVDLIQQEIIKNVYQQMGEVISRQSDLNLQIIMKSYYLQYAKNLPCQIREQVNELNQMVIKECVKIIIPNIQQTIGYRRDLTKMPVTLDRPINMSQSGTKMLYDKIAF
uniref:Minor capsid protein P8 central region domain-containing protein n=1 Tax=viral metagenome TaxID=1070528 RepID=A0A6C0E719_9ZZZZ